MRTGTGNSNRDGKEKRDMGITIARRSKVPWMAAVFLAALLLTPMIAGAATPAGTAITNAATVNYQDTSANNYSAVSNTTTVTVISVFGVSLAPVPVDQSVPSNTVAYYAYILTNTGNDNNTYALSAASGAGGNSWTVTLYADDGAGGGTANDGIHQAGETTVTSSTGVLAGGATYRFFLAVTVPAGTANGQTDDSVLTVNGANGGAADDTTDTVTTTAQAPALSVLKNVRNVTTGGTFDNTANAAPTQTLEYRVTVTNNGTVNATSVVLTDSDNANTTYVPGSMRIGPSNAYGGAGNLNPGDGNSDSAFPMPCNLAACGHGHVDGSGNVTAYLGNTANDGAAGPGGTITTGQTIYVYFRVTVD
jgi:uncharacterized repeat protein (TIGR01451 family)